MQPAVILIVDDSAQIRRTLSACLAQCGYVAIGAKSGGEALQRVQKNQPDLVLLDINMPGLSGLETCEMIRQVSQVPILILTVRNSEQDKVAALDAGADDFIVKPFSTPELLARIRAHLRRMPAVSPSGPRLLSFDSVEINLATRRVSVSGRQRRLTPKEFDLLNHLMANPNTVLTHKRLLEAVWGPEYADDVHYLHAFVRRLRKKIEPDPAKPLYLLTEPWVGYQFHVPFKFHEQA